jgi:fido (protein-threonine AMPylation protein)
MCAVAYKWNPIEDLPQNWRELISPELSSLASIWIEQSRTLKDSRALRQFNERLRREWAIETGIIEKLYFIERGTTEVLIEHGISASLIPHGSTDKPVHEIIALLSDQAHVLQGMFDFLASRRKLSTSYIKELYHALTLHQETVRARNGLGRHVEVDLLRGEWKRLPNNPVRENNGDVHEYCPPEHVSAEMDRLVEMHLTHEQQDVPPEIESSWLHHRFTQIHPFQDGNGRVARALASLVFIKAGWFPLVIDRNTYAEYIESLEKSDQGDLRALIKLFSSLQKKALIGALSLSESVIRDQEPINKIISSAIERINNREIARRKEYRKAFETANSLAEISRIELDEVAKNLREQLTTVDRHYRVDVGSSSEKTSHWYRADVIELAKRHRYYADTRTFSKWVRLRIREERQTELVLLFHSLEVEFLGIIAVTALIDFRDTGEDEERKVEGPFSLSKEIFSFSYNERPEDIISRFESWLNEVLAVGLEQWRQQL